MSNSGDSISPKYSAWLRGDDRYAALNYWIMWENSEVANGKSLNLLERLNHVYTDISIDETRGPSMFEKVLDLLYDVEGTHVDLSWRLLNKDLGSAVTGHWATKLRCRVDGLYKNHDISQGKLWNFVISLAVILEERIHDDTPIETWRLDPFHITELNFLQDPEPVSSKQATKRGEIHEQSRRSIRQYDALNPATDNARKHQLIIDSREQEANRTKEIWEMSEDAWERILPSFRRIFNAPMCLRVFRWRSSLNIAERLFPMVVRPELEILEMRCFQLPADFKSNPEHKGRKINEMNRQLMTVDTVPPEERLRLSPDCRTRISLHFSDEVLIPDYMWWLATYMDNLDELSITYLGSSDERGSNDKMPDPHNHQSLNVRVLRLEYLGVITRSIIARLNIERFQSIAIIQCDYLDYILMPMVFNDSGKHANMAPRLQQLQIFFSSFEIAQSRGREYHQHHLRDKQSALDFLRVCKSPLEAITIRCEFSDTSSLDRDRRQLSVSLAASIQPYSKTLRLLDLLYSDFDISLQFMEMLGRNFLKLTQLRVSSQGWDEIEPVMEPAGLVPRNYALGKNLVTALKAFRYPHEPFELTIIRTNKEAPNLSLPGCLPSQHGNNTGSLQVLLMIEAANEALQLPSKLACDGHLIQKGPRIPLRLLSIFSESLTDTDFANLQVYGIPRRQQAAMEAGQLIRKLTPIISIQTGSTTGSFEFQNKLISFTNHWSRKVGIKAVKPILRNLQERAPPPPFLAEIRAAEKASRDARNAASEGSSIAPSSAPSVSQWGSSQSGSSYRPSIQHPDLEGWIKDHAYPALGPPGFNPHYRPYNPANNIIAGDEPQPHPLTILELWEQDLNYTADALVAQLSKVSSAAKVKITENLRTIRQSRMARERIKAAWTAANKAVPAGYQTGNYGFFGPRSADRYGRGDREKMRDWKNKMWDGSRVVKARGKEWLRGFDGQVVKASRRHSVVNADGTATATPSVTSERTTASARAMAPLGATNMRRNSVRKIGNIQSKQVEVVDGDGVDYDAMEVEAALDDGLITIHAR